METCSGFLLENASLSLIGDIHHLTGSECDVGQTRCVAVAYGCGERRHILAVNLSTRSQAAAGGMSAAQLKDDKDFKEAVQFIIQKCSVRDRLSINCS